MRIKMIDMWYGDAWITADRIDIFFHPSDGTYRGNIYRSGRAIGDYCANGWEEVEKLFPQLKIEWAG